jgi:superfamily II DNA or RNA helicase
MILCLTATLQRLDGKEVLIKQYAPVCDSITLSEAQGEGWVSPIKEYVVLLDVDLTEYKA